MDDQLEKMGTETSKASMRSGSPAVTTIHTSKAEGLIWAISAVRRITIEVEAHGIQSETNST